MQQGLAGDDEAGAVAVARQRDAPPALNSADTGADSYDEEADEQAGQGLDESRVQELVMQQAAAAAAGQTVEQLSLEQLLQLRHLGFLLTPRQPEKLRQLQEQLLDRIAQLQLQPQPSRILYCRITSDCGFGCIIHRVAACLSRALRQQRTMLVAGSPIGDYGRFAAGVPPPTDCHSWSCFFEPMVDAGVEKRLGMPQSKMADKLPLADSPANAQEPKVMLKFSNVKATFKDDVPQEYNEPVKALYNGNAQMARLWYTGQVSVVDGSRMELKKEDTDCLAVMA